MISIENFSGGPGTLIKAKLAMIVVEPKLRTWNCSLLEEVVDVIRLGCIATSSRELFTGSETIASASGNQPSSETIASTHPIPPLFF